MARLTSADIDAVIKRVEYTVLPDGYTTVCTMFLDNNEVVHGMARCSLPAAEHPNLSQPSAFAAAKGQVWDFVRFRRADAAMAQCTTP